MSVNLVEWLKANPESEIGAYLTSNRITSTKSFFATVTKETDGIVDYLIEDYALLRDDQNWYAIRRWSEFPGNPVLEERQREAQKDFLNEQRDTLFVNIAKALVKKNRFDIVIAMVYHCPATDLNYFIEACKAQQTQTNNLIDPRTISFLVNTDEVSQDLQYRIFLKFLSSKATDLAQTFSSQAPEKFKEAFSDSVRDATTSPHWSLMEGRNTHLAYLFEFGYQNEVIRQTDPIDYLTNQTVREPHALELDTFYQQIIVQYWDWFEPRFINYYLYRLNLSNRNEDQAKLFYLQKLLAWVAKDKTIPLFREIFKKIIANRARSIRVNSAALNRILTDSHIPIAKCLNHTIIETATTEQQMIDLMLELNSQSSASFLESKAYRNKSFQFQLKPLKNHATQLPPSDQQILENACQQVQNAVETYQIGSIDHHAMLHTLHSAFGSENIKPILETYGDFHLVLLNIYRTLLALAHQNREIQSTDDFTYLNDVESQVNPEDTQHINKLYKEFIAQNWDWFEPYIKNYYLYYLRTSTRPYRELIDLQHLLTDIEKEKTISLFVEIFKELIEFSEQSQRIDSGALNTVLINEQLPAAKCLYFAIAKIATTEQRMLDLAQQLNLGSSNGLQQSKPYKIKCCQMQITSSLNLLKKNTKRLSSSDRIILQNTCSRVQRAIEQYQAGNIDHRAMLQAVHNNFASEDMKPILDTHSEFYRALLDICLNILILASVIGIGYLIYRYSQGQSFFVHSQTSRQALHKNIEESVRALPEGKVFDF